MTPKPWGRKLRKHFNCAPSVLAISGNSALILIGKSGLGAFGRPFRYGRVLQRATHVPVYEDGCGNAGVEPTPVGEAG